MSLEIPHYTFYPSLRIFRSECFIVRDVLGKQQGSDKRNARRQSQAGRGSGDSCLGVSQLLFWACYKPFLIYSQSNFLV